MDKSMNESSQKIYEVAKAGQLVSEPSASASLVTPVARQMSVGSILTRGHEGILRELLARDSLPPQSSASGDLLPEDIDKRVLSCVEAAATKVGMALEAAFQTDVFPSVSEPGCIGAEPIPIPMLHEAGTDGKLRSCFHQQEGMTGGSQQASGNRQLESQNRQQECYNRQHEGMAGGSRQATGNRKSKIGNRRAWLEGRNRLQETDNRGAPACNRRATNNGAAPSLPPTHPGMRSGSLALSTP
eukprot:gene23647-9177_t